MFMSSHGRGHTRLVRTREQRSTSQSRRSTSKCYLKLSSRLDDTMNQASRNSKVCMSIMMPAV
eukprot:1065979-Pelagomonas_calceolata.AAC.1